MPPLLLSTTPGFAERGGEAGGLPRGRGELFDAAVQKHHSLLLVGLGDLEQHRGGSGESAPGVGPLSSGHGT